MPSRLENEALHTAAATLPRAIEVKAIDDCTVEGSSVRNSMPVATIGGTCGIAAIPSPASGNSTKVAASTIRCSRQCPAPAKIASRDSLAPCRKNSSTMPASAAQLMKPAKPPRAGNSEASNTVPSSATI